MDTLQLRTHKDKSLQLQGRAIEVEVGSDPPTTFSVHEHLICSSSEFFKRAMNAHWEASKTRSVALKDEDPEVFEIYMHWLYCQTFPVENNNPGQDGNTEYLQLAKAYVLGEMLQDENFKDAVLDAILAKSRTKASDDRYWYPIGPVIRCIYDGTMESSNARRMLVDMYTYHGFGDWLTDWAAREDLPNQFLLDLAISVLDKRPHPSKSLANTVGICEYHEHAQDSATCYRAFLASKRETGQIKPGGAD